ncbi:hypothetical protein [Arthrobacter sp. ISL-65]|uniref:hypothetical protein n=1 Tax=Arthrobacter sp. ISL-65 TaxID=2819112 RepID=UPI001BE603F5|nr:hypothetical protein [Arthrobacter sp. ISL-65]MBT2547268.1 hypothetical protein [Arthrobacter sp. ISL-65]
MTTRQKNGFAAYGGSLLALLGMVAGYFALTASEDVNALVLVVAVIALVCGALLVSAAIVGIRKADN